MRNQLLRDADWAGMAHSLEIRVPLVDERLLRLCSKLSSNTERTWNKALLADAPSAPLPKSISARSKTGFTTPIHDWMKGEANTMLTERQSAVSQHWSRDWSGNVIQHQMPVVH